MLKALIKKQFLELNRQVFVDRKTGKQRSKIGKIGFGLLFLLVFVFVAGAFFVVAMAAGSALLQGDKSRWLYFALMGLLSILLGTFGSVFNTYASLYQAKDNELLLSMPIRPSIILLSRVTGVFGMSFFYSMIVWIPAMIASWIVCAPTLTTVLYPIILAFFITLFVTVLTCVLGWVVALIASRLKNKSMITVILALAFFGIYYYVCFQAEMIFEVLIANLLRIEAVIRTWLWPIYQLGSGAAGNLSSLLIFSGVTLAVFALCYYILSRSFISIITTKRSGKAAAYKERTFKQRSERAALLWREMKHFTSNPTYMLNAGLGVVILIFLAIFAIFKMPDISMLLKMGSLSVPWLLDLLPVVLMAAVCMIVSMNEITTPSVSLEGKTIWLIQSMPSSTQKILMAKQHLHVLLNCIPAALCTISVGYVFKLGVLTTLCILLPVIAYVWFIGFLGLTLNLLRPNLHWTNEAVPIKQSLNVVLVMFGGWILCAGSAFGFYLLRNTLAPELYLLLCAVLFIVVDFALYRWIVTAGVKRFDELS